MSGYSWTLPNPGGAGAAGTKARDAADALLGCDILFDGDMHVSAAGDYVLVEGEEAMRQSIYHRLLTRPGEYRRNPEYGVGVMSYVKRRRTTSVLDHLRGRIVDQLSLDKRIEEVISVTIENIDNGIKIALKVRISGKAIEFRPFNFTERPVTIVGGRTYA